MKQPPGMLDKEKKPASAGAAPTPGKSPRAAEFAAYKGRGGELTEPEFNKVLDVRVSQESMGAAFRAIRSAGLGYPEANEVEMAGRLIDGLPESRIPKLPSADNTPHGTWLLTEAKLLLGKSPAELFESMLGALFRDR